MSSSDPIPKAVLYYDARSAWSLAEKGYGKDEMISSSWTFVAKGENFSPSFLRLNPKGTVPTLIVPLENSLSPQMESRYKAIADTEALIAFLDKSRSAMSHTHTTSAAPAPALSPATVALSSTAKSIIALLHSDSASPELLFHLNARDLPALRTAAVGVSAFLKGRKEALVRYLAEDETKEVRVSEKTRTFWLEKKSATENSCLDSELSETGRKAREEYFEKTKRHGKSVLHLSSLAHLPLISIVDVHLAGWLHELVILSGGSGRDSGTVATARIEEHVGGGLHLQKMSCSAASCGLGRIWTWTYHDGDESEAGGLWDALASRPSWQKVFGVES
ncbi:hypothetical protein BJV77DRAFT_968756 [Russula vinacea]|nr:hypothetical protein BJV77DRAFT_968756 [Russula vinacea]